MRSSDLSFFLLVGPRWIRPTASRRGKGSNSFGGMNKTKGLVVPSKQMEVEASTRGCVTDCHKPERVHHFFPEPHIFAHAPVLLLSVFGSTCIHSRTNLQTQKNRLGGYRVKEGGGMLRKRRGQGSFFCLCVFLTHAVHFGFHPMWEALRRKRKRQGLKERSDPSARSPQKKNFFRSNILADFVASFRSHSSERALESSCASISSDSSCSCVRRSCSSSQ
jgi:hypothetical protein